MKREILSLPELANLIKELAKASPYTLTELYEYAGIPIQYSSTWRKGNGRAPNYQELAKLAERLDKPIEVFIYKDDVSYVYIQKEEYEKLIRALEKHLESISKSVKEIGESDLVNYKKYVG